MTRNTVKKVAARKSGKKAAKKRTVGSPKSPGKAAAKKKTVTEKERQVRAANLIANSEKKGRALARRKKPADRSGSEDLLGAIVDGMKEKKARNIMVLDLRKIENRVTDFFVICDADSRTHVNSIAGGVDEFVQKHAGENPWHAEGHQNGEWVLLDYINVVAHIFLRETREHYNIEALWGDAEITLIND